jgi:hypothetical protein
VWTWDLAAGPAGVVEPACEHPDSIYCVGVNRNGTIAALGSVDKVVRLWDPRTQTPFGVLKGHQDMVKALAVSADGTKCLSGGSDNMLKLWDVGERRCIATFRPHSDSIWCICVDPEFTRVYSGSRDGSVYVPLPDSMEPINVAVPSVAHPPPPSPHFPLVPPDTRFVTQLDWSGPDGDAAGHDRSPSTLLASEDSPVLALSVSADGDRLWTSTLLRGVQERSIDNAGTVALARTIEVQPPLIRFRMFSDGITVCTEDTAGRTKLWSLATATVTADLGETPFDDAVKQHNVAKCHVAKWCSIDTALGFLSVHLEPNDAFAAWVSEARIGGRTVDDPVNVGALVVRILLRQFQEAKYLLHPPAGLSDGGSGGGAAREASAAVDVDVANDESPAVKAHRNLMAAGLSHDIFTLPEHTQMILAQYTEPAHTICQLTLGTAADHTTTLIQECPEWIQHCLFTKHAPMGDKSKAPEVAVFVSPRKEKDASSKRAFPNMKRSVAPDRYVGHFAVSIRGLKAAIARDLNKGSSGEAVSASAIRLFHGDTELEDDTAISYVYQVLAKRKDIRLEYSRVVPK